MLRETDNHVHSGLREDEDGFAIPQWDLEFDALAECGWDDPNYGDPSRWPWWTDLGTWSLGRAPVAEDVFDDLPSDGLEDLEF